MPDTAATTPRWLPAYLKAKLDHPDKLLFWRLGDFYELLFADAEIGAKAMGITLTRRGDIRMCGVPVHSHELYLAALDEAGIRYAIHEGKP